MGNLPRLELTEEKSNLKNNDFIVFRHQSKGKSFKKVSDNLSKIKGQKNNKTQKSHKIHKSNKSNKSHKRKKTNKTTHKKSKKNFFGIFS